MKKNRNILDYLFICIIINLIPIILLKVFNVGSTIYTIATLLAYMLQTLLMVWKVKEKVKETSKKAIIVLVVFMGLQIITQVVNYIKWNSFLIKDIANIFSTVLNLYIYIYLCSKYEVTKEDFLGFMKKLIFVGLIACVYNIVINFSNILNLFNVEYSYELSISSFFPNRNQFAIFMLIMIISNIYIISNEKKKRYIFLQILFIINLILTMSRNAIIGLVALYGLIICFNIKKAVKLLNKKQIIAILSGILILILIAIIVLIKVPEIMQTIDRLFIRSYTINQESGRIKVWKNGLEISKNNFLTGVGRFKGLNINSVDYNSPLSQFHSIYVETLVSNGIVGVFGLIYLIYSVIKKIKDANTDEKSKKIMISSIIVFMIISCFETTCRFSMGYADTISTIYFFALPIIYSNINGIKKEETNEKI